jgi:hypothetical protein
VFAAFDETSIIVDFPSSFLLQITQIIIKIYFFNFLQSLILLLLDRICIRDQYEKTWRHRAVQFACTAPVDYTKGTKEPGNLDFLSYLHCTDVCCNEYGLCFKNGNVILSGQTLSIEKFQILTNQYIFLHESHLKGRKSRKRIKI